MSILSGNAIRAAVEKGEIQITPFDEALLNPASVDLRLGETFVRYRRIANDIGEERPLDSRKENPIWTNGIGPSGYDLEPGELYLMHTAERVATKRFVPVLDGKSSIGRLGIWTHVSAGFGDPGFDGQWTLEVVVTRRVRVYAGMKFAQMRFHTIEGQLSLYAGNYQGETSWGPVPSRSWKQFG